jgi:SAM-dependent methyltransferase
MEDGRAVVRRGYDAIADTYLAYRVRDVAPEERIFLDRVLARISRGSLVLDLGCGAGVPFTAAIAERARVVGVDISAAQLRLALERVPDARSVQADMATIAIRSGSFDAVTAFASTGHVPRALHSHLYRSIASWLRPGGWFAAQLPAGEAADEIDADWLGAPMYFSHPDAEGSLALIRDAGFDLESVVTVQGRGKNGESEAWLAVIATLPARS